MNNFLRVSATLREGGQIEPGFKILLLLGADSNNRVISGQWMGYVRNERVVHPFLYDTEAKTFLYGGEEHAKERTNLDAHPIEQGALFTLSGESEGEPFECTYEIMAVHRYDDSGPIKEEREHTQRDDASHLRAPPELSCSGASRAVMDG